MKFRRFMRFARVRGTFSMSNHASRCVVDHARLWRLRLCVGPQENASDSARHAKKYKYKSATKAMKDPNAEPVERPGLMEDLVRVEIFEGMNE
jgi:hypothetical protein